MYWVTCALVGALCTGAGACGSSSATGSGGSATGTSTTSTGSAGGNAGDPQTPPEGATAVMAWLAKGYYKSWACEMAPHAARSPSPHSVDRICSNDIISSNALGTGPWPAGAAAVKELYTKTTDTTPGGYAVYLKTQANSDGGANWYYYGSLTAGGPTVDGMGTSTAVMSECTSCHLAAGSDAAHTPSPGGRDFVYTPVQ